MTFLAPLWLIALIPWAGIVAWVMLGQRQSVGVPFIELWKGPEPATRRREKRRFERPSWFVVFTLIAMLLGILAAAGAAIAPAGGTRWPVTIILDRGITMSAKAKDDAGETRFKEVARRAYPMLTRAFGTQGPAELVVVPGGQVQSTTMSTWIDAALAGTTSFEETGDAVRAAVRERLAHTSGPVVVLSDQVLFDDGDKTFSSNDRDRIVQIVPTHRLQNIGIVRVGARVTPKPGVLVRLRNDGSDQTKARIDILNRSGTLGGHEIDLPKSGAEADYFFDLSAVDESLEVRLIAPDDLSADNVAWLSRDVSRVLTKTSQPEPLQRMIALFQNANPAPPDAKILWVGADTESYPADDPAILIVAPGEPPATDPAQQTVDIEAHPITPHLAPLVKEFASVEPVGTMPGGYRAILSRSGKPLLAVREADPRRVWVGMKTDRLSHSPAYVVLWTDLLTWAGGGHESFASFPMMEWRPAWEKIAGDDDADKTQPSPGLYRVAGGGFRAVNLTNMKPGDAKETPDWSDKLRRAGRSDVGANPLSGAFLLGAIVAVAIALMCWPGRGLTLFWGRRTV